MVQVRDLTERTLEERWAEVKDEEEWWDEIKPRTLSAVKVLMESAMESELIDQLLAARYRRTEFRRGYRNGYRYRSLLTELGPIERIRIPRDREGRYRTEVLPRYERRQSRVNQMVREMFLAGVSTRRVKEVIKPLLGEGVSAQTVSRICRSLDDEVGAITAGSSMTVTATCCWMGSCSGSRVRRRNTSGGWCCAPTASLTTASVS